ALRGLEDVLATIAPGQPKEITSVHLSGATLSRSVDNTDAHADFVRIGLVNAARAFAAVEPSFSGSGCYRDQLGQMTLAASSIDPDRKLSLQYTDVRVALRAAARMALAASNPQVASRRR